MKINVKTRTQRTVSYFLSVSLSLCPSVSLYLSVSLSVSLSLYRSPSLSRALCLCLAVSVCLSLNEYCIVLSVCKIYIICYNIYIQILFAIYTGPYIHTHSFILIISIAPLQVLYYSEALQTTARILYRSFTPKRTDNCR